MMKLLENIHQYDVRTFNWCMQVRCQALMTRLSRLVSHTADGPLYILLAIILAALEPVQGMNLLYAGLLAFAMERPAYLFLKRGFKRNRPAQILDGFNSFITPSDQFSFPSGHTAGAFVMAVLLSHFYVGVAWFLFPWAVLVGMARIFLGVHFPTDTLAGSLLGVSAAILSLTILGL